MNPRLAKAIINGLLVGLAIISIAPLAWMLSVSLMQPGEASHAGALESAFLKLYTQVWLPKVETSGIGIDPVGARELRDGLGIGKIAAHAVPVDDVSLPVFGEVDAGGVANDPREGAHDVTGPAGDVRQFSPARPEHEGDLALGRIGVARGELDGAAAHDLLEPLRQLAAHRNLAVRVELGRSAADQPRGRHVGRHTCTERHAFSIDAMNE